MVLYSHEAVDPHPQKGGITFFLKKFFIAKAVKKYASNEKFFVVQLILVFVVQGAYNTKYFHKAYFDVCFLMAQLTFLKRE